MFGRFNLQERAAQEFSAPPPEADGWEQTEDPEKVVELPALVMLRARTYRREFRAVQPGATIAGVVTVYAVTQDPGANVLLDRPYAAAGVAGVRGHSLTAGIIRNGGRWLNAAGATVNRGAIADWSTVSLESRHGADRTLTDRQLFELVTDDSWPFDDAAFGEAFGAEGLAAVRAGALAAVMEEYGRMSPRQQGEVLERAAGLEELRDFHPRDLKSALCERIFTTALAAAVGAADLPTLRRLVAGVLDVAAG